MKYRVKEIREQKGISQEELAEKSGVSRTTIWALEHDDSKVTTTKTLFSLATAMGVKFDDLFLPHAD